MSLHGILCGLLTLYYVILLARIIVSWIPQVPEPIAPIVNVVRALTDPVLNPIRGLLPPLRIGQVALDLSPLLLFFGLGILLRTLC